MMCMLYKRILRAFSFLARRKALCFKRLDKKRIPFLYLEQDSIF